MTARANDRDAGGDTQQVSLGQGEFTYDVLAGWGVLPDGWLLNDVAAVAVDRRDRVYVFNRGDHPLIIFDAGGNFLRSWGEGVFRRPHGLHIGLDDAVYCTDDGDHTVRKCTTEGKLLLELGVPGRAASFMSGQPFNRCTHTALSPDGDIYVSDGYGNACIHRFSADGKLLKTWGESGSGPGQFYIPHNVCCDLDGWVYVADRENHRIQVFDGDGTYEAQWTNVHRPCALCMGSGRPIFYVGEVGPAMRATLHFPNLGPRLSVLGPEGKLLARVGTLPAGITPGRFVAPHGIAVDSVGDVYVGEVSYTAWPAVFPDEPIPSRLPCLHKLRRRH